MKALYSLWSVDELVAKAVWAGVDTLLVTAHDLPWDKSSGYYDAKEKVVDTISRYGDKCKIYLVPLWVRDPIYYSIPDTQQWKTEDGRYLKKTPCPTSVEYITSRVSDVVDFCAEHKVDGVIWDLEHLSPRNMSHAIIPFYLGRHPMKRCWCVSCTKYNLEDLWKVHAGLIKKQLEKLNVPVHGQMPYSYGWTMRQYPGELYHFTEETYKDKLTRWESWTEQCKWNHSYKKYGVNPKIVPGVWCEYLKTEENLIRYIKKLYKDYGSVWLYSHEFLNKIPNPHADYTMKGSASDRFFEELRKI